MRKIKLKLTTLEWTIHLEISKDGKLQQAIKRIH
jgi:hypothetical protein